MDNQNSDGVNFLVGVINDVLSSQGICAIEENEDFVENEMSFEHYRVYTVENANAVKLYLVLSYCEVAIGVDEFMEVVHLAYDDVFADPSYFREWLTNLFFGRIVIKRCWFGFNYFYIRKPDGRLELIRKYYEGCGFVLFWPLAPLHLGCKSVEYFPVYKTES